MAGGAFVQLLGKRCSGSGGKTVVSHLLAVALKLFYHAPLVSPSEARVHQQEEREEDGETGHHLQQNESPLLVDKRTPSGAQ
jgi:hypothetical protein